MPIVTIDKIACELNQICPNNRVSRLRGFGSFSQGEERSDTDVDLLVDYESGYVPTFFSMSKLERELSEAFGGRRIDLARPDDLHWFIRCSVLASARTLYEK